MNASRRKLARAISLLESSSLSKTDFQSYFDKARENRSCRVIALSGPPGVGKSTVAGCISKHFLETGHKIAVLAIDPISPYSGGAVLGDRIRFLPDDYQGEEIKDNFYLRSLSAQMFMGGVPPTIAGQIVILMGSGFDRIIVETAGVGQGEYLVRNYSDHFCLVLMPESGDEVQALKSGILEVADSILVNKSDLKGAPRYYSTLRQNLDIDDLFLVCGSDSSGFEKFFEQVTFDQSKITVEGLVSIYVRDMLMYQLLSGGADEAKLSGVGGKSFEEILSVSKQQFTNEVQRLLDTGNILTI